VAQPRRLQVTERRSTVQASESVPFPPTIPPDPIRLALLQRLPNFRTSRANLSQRVNWRDSSTGPWLTK